MQPYGAQGVGCCLPHSSVFLDVNREGFNAVILGINLPPALKRYESRKAQFITLRNREVQLELLLHSTHLLPPEVFTKVQLGIRLLVGKVQTAPRSYGCHSGP